MATTPMKQTFPERCSDISIIPWFIIHNYDNVHLKIFTSIIGDACSSLPLLSNHEPEYYDYLSPRLYFHLVGSLHAQNIEPCY